MKIFKRLIVTFLFLVVFGCGFVAVYSLFITKDLEIDEKKLCKNTLAVNIFDGENKVVDGVIIKGEKIDISLLPKYVKDAFIAVEDKRFLQHNGVDLRAIFRALKNNIIHKSTREGGSTITQQLIKNTHLSGEKTFERKIKEIVLAMKMEKTHSKDEILSYYLNGVYFGEGAYGIESASKTYFNKSAKDLSLNEAVSLASTVKAPCFYNPSKEKCFERKNLILKLMEEQNYISHEEYKKAKDMPIPLNIKKQENQYISNVLEQAFNKANISPYENTTLTINTYFDKNAQKILENDLENVNGGGIIMSNKGKVKACFVKGGLKKRQPASTLKPLVVYAPAIEEKIINLATPILDKPCDFGGWQPKNYNDKYYGFISAQQAILKSLNIPAIKIMQSVGLEKSFEYAKKMSIDCTDCDLSLSLGAVKKGMTLLDLCGSYTALCNNGKYVKPQFIKSIVKNGKIIYEDRESEKQVFNHSTCELISYALNKCTFDGTAKAIGKRPYEICAKTGTNGSKNGNSDGWTIAYSSQDIFGVWLGNEDGSLMPNNITGGIASRYVAGILNEYYKDFCPPPFEKSGQVEKIKLCKLAYQKGALEKAPCNEPEKFTFETSILKETANNLFESKYFYPILYNAKISVLKNKVTIEVEKMPHISFEIYIENNNSHQLVGNTSQNTFTLSLPFDGIYQFVLLPYTFDNLNQKITGDEIFLKKVNIDLDDEIINSPWWEIE